jgi:two-component system nitrate/nitrite response regulator NarL
MQQYKVLIVDDHEVVIQGIMSLLQEHEEYILVGRATNGQMAVEQARALKPDIIIMDISMPGMNGLEATRKIKEFSPEVRIIIYTMFSDPEHTLELFKSGISAFVLKDGPVSDLIQALTAVKSDATYFRTIAPDTIVNHLQKGKREKSGLDRLSRREREVFVLLADGGSIKAIAEKLFISPKTVETHKYHIFEKLKVNTIPDLTKIAIRGSLI